MLKSAFLSTQKWAKRLHLPCEAFNSLPSTNTLAKQKAFEQTEPLRLYLADAQTAGRGRGEATWMDSGTGQSLAISFQYSLTEAPQPLMAPLAGLALYAAAAHSFHALQFSLKPPNDLYLQNKKLAGLLVETVARGSAYSLIVGLGLNVLSAPPLEVATSLCGPLGLNGSLDEVVWFEFLTRFKTLLSQYVPYACRAHLPSGERALLLEALNAFPLKSREYLDLQPDGQMMTSAGPLSWQDL